MVPHDHRRREPDAESEAFELYYRLGPQRTYTQVAATLGVSLPTIKRRAKAEHWQARLRERDAQTAQRLTDHFHSGRLAVTERNLKIVRAAVVRLTQDVTAGRIRGHLGDLPRLIQLEQDLHRRPPPSHTASTHDHGTEAEQRALARESGLNLLREFPDAINDLIAIADEHHLPIPSAPDDPERPAPSPLAEEHPNRAGNSGIMA